jgi:hypothetical protein
LFFDALTQIKVACRRGFIEGVLELMFLRGVLLTIFQIVKESQCDVMLVAFFLELPNAFS